MSAGHDDAAAKAPAEAPARAELRGRLGLETARIPQQDRHGLLWLGRGQLYVAEGTLRFSRSCWTPTRKGKRRRVEVDRCR